MSKMNPNSPSFIPRSTPKQPNSSIRYATGPAKDGSIGFTMRRTTMVDYLDTPSVKPYVSISTTIPRARPRQEKPRIYSNMKIEDYPPYKALNLGPGLYGPIPYVPSECACGSIGRYEDPFCMCAISCMSHPKYALYKANPELYKAEQEELRLHRRRYLLWIEERNKVENAMWIKSKPIIYQFERLRDQESPIGCWSCEQDRYGGCRCECEYCGDKYCDNSCDQDCDYI